MTSEEPDEICVTIGALVRSTICRLISLSVFPKWSAKLKNALMVAMVAPESAVRSTGSSKFMI